MRAALLISYYFPPMGMGGVQRALKFAKYLPEFGWRPVVLTTRGERYYAHDPSLLGDIPSEARVLRVSGLDPTTVRLRRRSSGVKTALGGSRLSIWRQLEDWLMIPDGKIVWTSSAFNKGLDLCRRENVSVIFTTSPPHSVHLAGYLLKKITGIPWIADFRDAWTEGHFERHKTGVHRALKEFCERAVLRTADRVIGVTSIIAERLSRKAPRGRRDTFLTLTNGYDEEDFADVSTPSKGKDVFAIVYCGTLGKLADPTSFLMALRRIVAQRPEVKMKLVWAGRSPGLNVSRLVMELGLLDRVEFKGYLNHRKIIGHMCQADLLLLLISPVVGGEMIMTGKIFEYLRAGQPILALIPEGVAAQVIRSTGAGVIVAPDRPEKIKDALLSLYDEKIRGELRRYKGAGIEQFDRRRLTKTLAHLFDELVERRGNKR